MDRLQLASFHVESQACAAHIVRHGEKLCTAQCTLKVRVCFSLCFEASSFSCQRVLLMQERGSKFQQHVQSLDAVCMNSVWC